MPETCSFCGRLGHWRPDCPEIALLVQTGSRFPRFPKRQSSYTLKLTSSPVRARARKLRTRWTCEVNQDLVAMYSVRAEDQLVDAIEEYQSTMRQIRVDKVKLLKIIRKNRTEHRATFLEAQESFREVAIKAMDQQLKDAREGKPFQLRSLTVLEAPEDHTKDYDRSIQMLEMSVDKEIVISEQEFQNFVQDTWGWSRDWASNVSNYVSKNSRNYGKLAALSTSDE
jgi:hypothetical protein